MHVSKSSEDERRTSQSSDDTIQKKVKKQEEPQTMRRENQIPKRDSEGFEEPQQSSAPAQTQVVVKVIPSPAPKVNYWEVRKNNQQTAPVSAQSEAKRSEVEATQDTSSDNILSMSRNHSESFIESAFPHREFLVPKTSQKRSSCPRWSPSSRGKNHPKGTSGKLGQKKGRRSRDLNPLTSRS